MAKKTLYTKKLGNKVARRAKSVSIGRYHVISGEAKKWTVVSDGSVRPVKSFSTQKDAVDYAKQTALKQTGEVVVHGETGQISDVISYAK